MKIRADIAERLRAGVPHAHIARELHVARITVQRHREALGLPAPKAGPPGAASLKAAFRANLKPVEDGHVEWNGYFNDLAPTLTFQRRTYSAYRIAFEVHHGRTPVGRVRPGCGKTGCVAGDHVEDEPMRHHKELQRHQEQQQEKQLDRLYTKIFGGTS